MMIAIAFISALVVGVIAFLAIHYYILCKIKLQTSSLQ